MGHQGGSCPVQGESSVAVPADPEEPELTDLPLNYAVRLARKAEARAIFVVAAEERSVHSVEDLIATGEYALSVLKKGQIPKYSLSS